ncbi:HEAT repeat domain-containing protein [Micromonospora rubida]
MTQLATRVGTTTLLGHRPGLIDAAAAALASGTPILRSHAVAALGGIRAAAVAALVRLRVPDALDTACCLLRDNPDDAVREHAAWALAELADRAAAGALRAALDDPSEFVRTAAAGSLAVLDRTA